MGFCMSRLVWVVYVLVLYSILLLVINGISIPREIDRGNSEPQLGTVPLSMDMFTSGLSVFGVKCPTWNPGTTPQRFNSSLLLAGAYSAQLTDANSWVNNSLTGFRENELIHTISKFKFDFTLDFILARNVYAYGEYPYIWNCDFAYHPIGCRMSTFSSPPNFHLKSPSVTRLVNVIILKQPWSQHFYHFTIESLPRIAPYIDMLLNDRSIQVLVDQRSPVFEVLGLLPSQIIVDDSKTLYFIERVIIPKGTYCGNGNPIYLRMLQKKLNEYSEKKAGRIAAKPFCSIVMQHRQPKTSRAIENHEDLVTQAHLALRARGCNCSIVDFRWNEPLASTAAKHYNADLVIGPHGAGLSNMIFTRPGTPMIEIHPLRGNSDGDTPNLCHQVTSIMLGSETKLFVTDNGSTGSTFRVNDITVIVDTIVETISENGFCLN